MCNFIEDYLNDPSLAISAAQNSPKSWYDQVDDEIVYSQIASPQFKLYQEIIGYNDFGLI